MDVKYLLGSAIKKRLGSMPGQVVEREFGITRTDTSKIRRGEWQGITIDRLSRLGLMVGVKLVYKLEACEPARAQGKAGKSKFDVDSMNVEIF